ncbi:MAG: cytochrome c3 family protein [Desulfobulbaceae bacterium]|nr:cytochrome c3 family protein [Desulfobulbaceae bacterium]HIJ78268.1 hypothetical protein [Deltaproteobacteria bacterium]
MKIPVIPTVGNQFAQTGMAIGLLVCLFFSATLLSPRPALAEEPEILSPPADAIIYARGPLTHVIVRQKDTRTANQVRIRTSDDTLIAPVRIQPGKDYSYIHFEVPLIPGKNLFEITPSGKELSVKYRPLRSLLNAKFNAKNVYLFHRTEAIPASCSQCHNPDKIKPLEGISGQAQPLCYSCHKNILDQAVWKHSPAVNMQCLACHQKSESPLTISIPEGKVESTCFKCHTNKKSWLAKNHIHGPVGTGDCTVCHNPHGDNYYSQLWADGKAELCVACHTDKKTLIEDDSPIYYIHGILKGAGCTICHSPHATDIRFQLYKPINELCTSCHTALKGVTKGHPVGGHPNTGVKDPRRPERMLACTSCHNPHGSDFKFLLIGDILGGHVCSQCHN